MMVRLLVPIVVMLFIGCTTVHYHSPRLSNRTQPQQSAALLPFEMIFTGNVPKGMTPKVAVEIEESESLMFQASLYHALLAEAGAGGGSFYMELQPIGKTNRELAAHGIGIQDSWDMAPEDLAGILGVDAVVRTQVVKARYLSDAASFAVEMGSVVADHLRGP